MGEVVVVVCVGGKEVWVGGKEGEWNGERKWRRGRDRCGLCDVEVHLLQVGTLVFLKVGWWS